MESPFSLLPCGKGQDFARLHVETVQPFEFGLEALKGIEGLAVEAHDIADDDCKDGLILKTGLANIARLRDPFLHALCVEVAPAFDRSARRGGYRRCHATCQQRTQNKRHSHRSPGSTRACGFCWWR